MPPVTQSKVASKATPTMDTPPPAPPAALKASDTPRPILTPVTVEAPMTRLPGDPYKQRRIDLDLNAVEAQALRDLYDGLTVKGEFSDRRSSPSEAIRWLLRRAGEQFAANGGTR